MFINVVFIQSESEANKYGKERERAVLKRKRKDEERKKEETAFDWKGYESKNCKNFFYS